MFHSTFPIFMWLLPEGGLPWNITLRWNFPSSMTLFSGGQVGGLALHCPLLVCFDATWCSNAVRPLLSRSWEATLHCCFELHNAKCESLSQNWDSLHSSPLANGSFRSTTSGGLLCPYLCIKGGNQEIYCLQSIEALLVSTIAFRIWPCCWGIWEVVIWKLYSAVQAW